MRRIGSFLMAVLLMAAFMLPAQAATDSAEQAADTLYFLGLFRGTGTDQNGEPLFALERPAVRSEAVVMLIRLMGRERDALACTSAQPFTDVPQWADRYVAYAYEQGLTNGIGGGRFGSNLETTGNMYLAFVLRALGYRDSGAEADYTYATAAAFAARIGVTERDYSDATFLRGDIAEVSLSALSFPLYGSEQLLIEDLVEDGAVSAADAQAAGFPVDGGSLAGQQVSISVVQQDDWSVILDAAQIKKAFPTARLVCRSTYFPALEEQVRQVTMIPTDSLEEQLVLDTMVDVYFKEKKLETLEDKALYFNWDREGSVQPLLMLLDRNSNVVGLCRNYDGQGTAVFTRVEIDGVGMADRALEQIRAALSRKDQLEVVIDTDDPQSGWDDGTGMAYHYPVYLNGKEMTGDYWLIKDPGYQQNLNMIQSNGGDFEQYLEQMLYDKFTGGFMMIRTDENGTEHAYGELSQQVQSSYAYDEHWDRYGNLVSARYGYRTKEHRSQPEFVGVCDKSGNLLGYTILETTE